MAVKILRAPGGLSESDLQACEQRLNIRLPEQYRAFLLKYNGGRPEPDAFNYKYETGPYTDSCVDWFLSVNEGKHADFEDYFKTFKIDDARVAPDLIPIAYDPGGNLICISVSSSEEGAVYFWDQEEETDPPSYTNTHLIADSFQEFLDVLYEPEEIVEDDFFAAGQMVLHGNTGELDALLRSHPEMLDQKDNMGFTFIEWASMRNQLDMVKFFLDRGAVLGRSLEFAKKRAEIGLASQELVDILEKPMQ